MAGRSTTPMSSEPEPGTTAAASSPEGSRKSATGTPPTVASSNEQPKKEEDGLFVTKDEVMETVTDDEPSTGSKRSNESLDASADDNADASAVDNAASDTQPPSKRTKTGAPSTRYRIKFDLLPVTGIKLAPYCPSFAQAEQHVTEACDIFLQKVAELKSKGYRNEEIEIVCSELGNCRIPSNLYPEVKPISCLGATGKGKSSTINAIMGETRAAFQHTGSKRGTYVTTEYRAVHPGQAEVYRVEIKYLSIEGIKRLVMKFCGDALKNAKEEAEDENSDESDAEEEVDEEDRDLHRKKAETAIECLCDILCREPKFSTPAKAEAFFRRNYDQTLQDVWPTIEPALEEALAYSEITKDCRTLPAQDDRTLQQILKQETRGHTGRKNDRREPSIWPFITHVVIKYRNDILNAGVILADTPGSGDKNLHVVENTYRSLGNAGTVLIVADHSRLVDNDVLDEHLRKCMRLGKSENIILVVTKIDELPAIGEDERTDEFTEQELAPLIRAEEACKDLERQIRKTEDEKRTARTADPARFMQLDSELEALKTQMPVLESQVKETHVRIRCLQLKEQAAGMMRKIDTSRLALSLKVFPVSNTQYQLAHSGSSDKALFLSKEASGVPALQRELLAIAAGGKFKSLKHICTEKLPWIFNGIDGILSKPLLERRSELRTVVLKCIQKNQTIVDEVEKSILLAYDETVDARINSKIVRWSSDAGTLVNDWETLNGGTFLALCRRGGKWRHKTKGDFNWNQELHDIFRQRMSGAFELLHDKVEAAAVSFDTKLQDRLGALVAELTYGQHSQGTRMEPFKTFCEGTCKDIMFAIAQEFAALFRYVNKMRTAFVVEPEGGDYKEHIVGSAMDKLYKDCVVQAPIGKAKPVKKGKKSKSPAHKARVAKMRAILEDPENEDNIFRVISRMGRKKLEDRLNVWARDGREIVHEGFRKILADFDRRFQDGGAVKSEEEDPEVVRQLQMAINEAMEIINGPVKKCMEECKAFEEEQG